jgi:cysteinyl-tRNA synthetase
MGLKIYNTLNRKKEEFKPNNGNNVGIYTCGLTVYNYGHIGNFRSFLFEDLLVRYLVYKGYNVTHVMNITDVDDKTIKNSRKNNLSLYEYTNKYTDAFFEDAETLNMRKAEHYPKATEHIKEMLDLIEKIEEKGRAYKTSDNSVYFKISEMKDYGKLSKIDRSQLREGASGRVTADEYDRENISDFTLWKGYTEEDGDVYWESKYGKGRPGWHIECSAMSMKYLGETFDIHCGGIDNMFPHHENEIAQSESATGKKFVNYWMHAEHVLFKTKNTDEEKMSKSLGNVVYIRDLLEKGYTGKAIRFALISVHYKQQLAYSEDRLIEYQSRLKRYQDFIRRLKQVDNNEIESKYNVDNIINKGYENFEKYMDDDLNISPALASMDEVISEVNKNFDKLNKKEADKVLDYLKKLNTVLAVFTFEENDTLDKEVEQLIKEREEARKKKNFQKADDIRNKLKDMGIVLEDTANGTKWKKIT